MLNMIYPKGGEKVWRGEINMLADDISVAIVSNAYTYSSAHEFLSSVGVLVGTALSLTNKTVTGGVFDAADANFGQIAAGSTAKAIVFFKNTGNAATSPLLFYIDEISGFPFPTNGGEVKVPWSDGPYKIVSLV